MRRGLLIYDGRDELAMGAAAFFIDSCRNAISEKGLFTVVLSGGNTPIGLYKLLASGDFGGTVDWRAVHLFWGDERSVPPESAESNFNTVRRSLISKIDIPPGNIHRIKGELPPEEAASAYEKSIRDFFGLSSGELPRFDLVLLGMGADGHTLSIFPGTEAACNQEKLAAANYVDKLKAWRITLTLRAITDAVMTLFLVSGREKAEALKEVLVDGEGKYPASAVTGRKLLWLVDKEAALLMGE
ncbi:MAG TPA: 6-phosphogluconolactonase [Deltaproteobacteria bacterium]|nr:MAG: 6-phosphogluconolactonase [Deltaproteobacteria bacterium GWA2_55_82]OGQ62319.1 MAG: 6-phosphogluconolactonase [Deltaproteobacteria bacterium RIFCSPLOWO2_02_FULL_55_12]OIJ74431.1 MAG: 6-phosphogluconolactonase [Deltaproteobacteria bacterium GWC2_55_46]HBG47084.1 6-phosphogluconolactonase [Deltaproteobacteria bacterium]HCY10857.1 6-phosphogluconolactonase [Deltaproteobacteria bacterium]